MNLDGCIERLVGEEETHHLVYWIKVALRPNRPRVPGPLLVSGSGAGVFVRSVMRAMVHLRLDCNPVPPSWLVPGSALPAEPPAVLVHEVEETDDVDQLEVLASRTALLLGGEVVPTLPGSTLMLVDFHDADTSYLESIMHDFDRVLR